MQPEESSTRPSAAAASAAPLLPQVVAAFESALRAALGALTRTRWLFVAALIVQLPLVFNPGYLSHDELQWLAFSDQPSWSLLPWNGWFDFRPFQYRPLTFNLWLLLSHLFGYSPMTMHLLRVLAGVIVALLLQATLLGFGVTAARASIAALVFLLLPEVVFTHAWIGTYADSLCLGFALGAILLTLRAGTATSAVAMLRTSLAVSVLTALALASKESAVLIPVLLVLVAAKRRDRVLAVAIASSALVVSAYLLLRLDTILYGPRDGGGYAWSIGNIPRRLAEYAMFPFEFDRFEATGAAFDTHRLLATLCWLVMAGVAATAGWRVFVAFCLGWMIALGPTLILSFSSSQYGYLAAAYLSGFFAVTWPDLRGVARTALAGAVLLAVVHGENIADEMRRIGRIQHNLYAELPQLVATHAAPLRIKAERVQEDIILRRLLFDIPSYRRIPLGDRLISADHDTATADYVMREDGRLRQL